MIKGGADGLIVLNHGRRVDEPEPGLRKFSTENYLKDEPGLEQNFNRSLYEGILKH